MTALWLLLLFPLAWPFVAKLIWGREFTWGELAANIGIIVGVVTIIWFIASSGQTSDTELINGKITDKTRVHGSYVESYDCHCHEVCEGSGKQRSCSEHCSTCYRDHYTVHWDLASTIGEIPIQHEDWTSTAVYALPNPAMYNQAYIGEPCSKEQSYTNYIKAVPESLFNTDKDAAKKQYAKFIPTYPQVYGLFKVTRVINVGSSVPTVAINQLNDGLGEMLEELGPKKQANIILILTNIKDPGYRYAVEAGWLGGKKNDIVIFIGTDNMNIVWTDVMTFGLNRGNELFHVLMRDRLKDVGLIDPSRLLAVIHDTIDQKFDRIHMSKFQYLRDQIEPPTWVMILLTIISIAGSLGLSFYFANNDINESNY